jgi:formiminotetrahydrofolate cyclodeaminase
LLRAGTTGAHLNVGINLESIADASYRTRIGDEARDLIERAAAIA